MRIYIDCLIILKWQIDLCIKIGGDLKISNTNICIVLGGAFQEKLQNHYSYKNIISYVSSSKRGRLLASMFQYLLIDQLIQGHLYNFDNNNNVKNYS